MGLGDVETGGRGWPNGSVRPVGRREADRLSTTAPAAWSAGLLKEGFTDADNFGVTFPSDWPIESKTLALAAVFLIDLVHFENKGNR